MTFFKGFVLIQCLVIAINAATIRDLLSRTKYADHYDRYEDDSRRLWSIDDYRLEVGKNDIV